MCKLKENKAKFGTAFAPSKLLNDRKYKRIIGSNFRDDSLIDLKVYIINF
tara:strand:- start:1030 stop:1179 length:150 start_codon:yes stop_codon:yes gene_type:complete